MKAELAGMEAVDTRWGDLVELTKPRITLMVLITMAAGAFLARPSGLPIGVIVPALVATGLLASAASALNQVLECREDGLMARTCGRPLPAGRVERGWVLSMSTAATAIALLLLAWRVNPLTAALGGATSFAYLFLYTPLKKRTPLATLVGAVPGALPPVMGWAAAAGRLDVGAWVLFGVVFLWQIPHFLAIAWLYREDYRRGGFAVLPVIDPKGGSTASILVGSTVLLIALTLASPSVGLGGSVHLVASLVAGAVFLASGLEFARARSQRSARRVLLTSVVYLPVVMIGTLLDYLP